MPELRIAIDVGGTFTDAVSSDEEGRLRTAKVRTRPDALADSVAEAVAAILANYAPDPPAISQLLYGTTIATNALLARALSPIALLVTAGFREILEINGMHDEDHHEPGGHHDAQARLVPLEHIYEVHERIERDGRVRVALDPLEIERIAALITESGRTVVAVTLLHSYREPMHEQRIREIFTHCAPTLRVVLSAEVLPELREYERTIVTCLNAALLPLMHDHLQEIDTRCGSRLLLMKSSGGLSSAEVALRAPLTTALSGPSAAVIGACYLARQLALPQAISIDIGGTSTDVALIEQGHYRITNRAEIAGYPLKTPAIDLLTIGAGGGSMANHGSDQRWRIGPQSAGAVPGPVCYGQGGKIVTLTDAHLVLGRLPASLLGGAVPLDRARAEVALAEFGRVRDLDAIETARGLLRIASFAMCGAIRRLAVQRGYAPETHALIALGGAGPLHAAELALLLGIKTIVVPPAPGMAAAFGLLTGAVREDAVQTYPQSEDALDVAGSAAHFAALEARVRERITRSGFSLAALVLQRAIDIRYVGMTTEFTVPVTAGPLDEPALLAALEAFHAAYEAFSGRAYRGQQAVEIINLRMSGTVRLPAPPVIRVPRVQNTPLPIGERAVYFLETVEAIRCPVYSRDTLGADSRLIGPCVIEQYDATILLPPGFTLRVDDYGNALLSNPA